jgi:hypothetical protein
MKVQYWEISSALDPLAARVTYGMATSWDCKGNLGAAGNALSAKKSVKKKGALIRSSGKNNENGISKTYKNKGAKQESGWLQNCKRPSIEKSTGNAAGYQMQKLVQQRVAYQNRAC